MREKTLDGNHTPRACPRGIKEQPASWTGEGRFMMGCPKFSRLKNPTNTQKKKEKDQTEESCTIHGRWGLPEKHMHIGVSEKRKQARLHRGREGSQRVELGGGGTSPGAGVAQSSDKTPHIWGKKGRRTKKPYRGQRRKRHVWELFLQVCTRGCQNVLHGKLKRLL